MKIVALIIGGMILLVGLAVVLMVAIGAFTFYQSAG